MQPDIRTIKNPVPAQTVCPLLQVRYIPTMLMLDLLCAAATTVADVALPLIVRNITQLAVDDAALLTVAHVLRIGLFYIALRIVDAAADYYMTSQGHIMGSYIERDMRFDLFSHLQKLGFSVLFRREGRADYGAHHLRSVRGHGVRAPFPRGNVHRGHQDHRSFVILLGINPMLTLIVFAALPLMYLIARYFPRPRCAAPFRSGATSSARSTRRWRTACWASAW